jgi:predicted nucleic acid-binding protein
MPITLMLDTNVLLDKFLVREPYYRSSNLVCMLGVFGDAENYLSVNMLTDLFYFLDREFGAARAQELLEDSLEFFHVCSVSAEDGVHCLKQRWSDFEDCLVARCAENINADYIITRNKNDFTASLVPALTPDELLALLEARKELTYQWIV